VRGAAPEPDADLSRQREVVDAFRAAARDGDLKRLVATLHPDVVLRADTGAAASSREVQGAEAVAGQALLFSQLASRPALVNGAVGQVSFRDGELFSVLGFTVAAGRIVSIDILADAERLARLDFADLD